MARMRLSTTAAVCALAIVAVASCRTTTASSPTENAAQSVSATASAVDPTFVTRDHFVAAVEMQISGEPFAQSMGRALTGYSRDYLPPNIYFNPADGGAGQIDLPGFSSAVESYEYSKQPMNNIAFESGAGTSLAFGPVLNAAGATGTDALAILRGWVQQMGAESNATSRFVHTQATADNPLGWPGFWPTLLPFASWDPSIQPTNASTGCSISSDDDPGASGAYACDDYECDYTTLHLPNRQAQVQMVIDPGSSGWAGWKEALWTLNYLQVMHDSAENPVTTVPVDQLSVVGTPGNTVLGSDGPGNPTVPGTFLGSSDIEGFQAGNFLQILDNQAQQWLTALTTTDGSTLGGFASLGDALAYAPTSPLQWFPGAISVTETTDDSGFPRPVSYAITLADSDLLDLSGLLGAFSSVYALTDQSNTQVGGSQPVLAYFDGDPFPVQNQTPTGAPTLHDRALAMMRVAFVNIDRLHVDPTTGLFVDDVGLAGGNVSRGTTLSTDVAAYALLALRTARRALDSELTLYSNTTPDIEGAACPLDAFAGVDGVPFSTRLDQLIRALAAVFTAQLTTEGGTAYAGWNLAGATPTDTGTSLDAHAAAIRGLLVAYLATGDASYRERAQSVFDRLESAFYVPSGRFYRTLAGDSSMQVTFTPRRFGLLQGALRDMYELVALLPGNQSMQTLIEDRVARLNKLVLNGWDDRNENQVVEWPTECTQVGTGPDGQPLGLGGLQMAERVLTGESGSEGDSANTGPRVIATDRDRDCVPEISAARLPSALANSITFSFAPSPTLDWGSSPPPWSQ